MVSLRPQSIIMRTSPVACRVSCEASRALKFCMTAAGRAAGLIVAIMESAIDS